MCEMIGKLQIFDIQFLNQFMSRWLLLLAILFLASADFNTFKNSMEAKVKKLANDMSEIYAKRCESNILACEIKSFNQCEGTSNKKCFEDFPKSNQCISDGVYMSEDSATRFPNSMDVTQLSNDQRHFVCTSAVLQQSFKELDANRNKQYGLAYIGNTFGSIRTYPTFTQKDGDQCVDYDPRYRPWYVTATSGGKNVILIIDTSGSMGGNRITLAKEAAKSVVNTLSNNDFLGVIVFGSSAQTLGSDKIVRATIEHKTKLEELIEQLPVNGMTNYQEAFRLGFSMLTSAQNDEFGAPCADAEDIFLFLTDGSPTKGQLTSQGLISIIDGLNTFDITMFTYALGSGIDLTILKSLSCKYNGIMYEVEDSDSSELATLMKSYYIYISEGISIEEPVWTQPYEDFFGFGRMVTVSMPIYYTQASVRKILGVAGIDVTMETFKEFGLEEEVEVTKKLISNMPCHSSSLSSCNLEDLRPSNSKCGVTDCPAVVDIQNCSSAAASDIFLQVEDTSTNVCCGLTVGAAVGIIVAVVVVVAVAIGVIIYKVKKSNAQKALENPNQNKKQETQVTYINQPHEISNQQFNQQNPNYPPPNYPPNYPPPNYPPQYNNAY